MVYRGRPSASCSSCRGRRIKCDKKKPNCTQCTRIHIVCPGYRDPLDQNFRDESESVIKRAQKSYKNASHDAVRVKGCASRKPGGNSPAGPDSFDLESLELGHERTVSSPILLFSLSQAIEEVAVVQFMSSYVPGSHFDYLPWVYTQPRTGMALLATIRAAAMAFLARELGQSKVMDMARRSYAIALLETNSALADSSTAVNDTTLISVLLLSLFEAIVWAGSRTPSSWNTHTCGALALIKLRGSQQLETPVGLKLFVQVANIICVNSIQQKTRLPSELIDLVELAMRYDGEWLRYRLLFLTGEVSKLLSDIDKGDMTVEEVVDAARCLDDQYTAFAESSPLGWRYQEVTLAASGSAVHEKTLHRYPSQRVAQLWNSYRMTRILLNETIHAYAFSLPYPSRSRIQDEAVASIQRMSENICASIPQFANSVKFSKSLNPQSPCPHSLLAVSEPESISTKAATASLLWPLSTVRGTSLASEEVRAYAVDWLQFLSREFRVPQAEKGAQESCEFDSLQNGLHMFYVS